jgi:hypothetical protein
LSLLVLVCGKIHEGGKVLDNITIVVPDRTDEEGGPKFAAILTAVKDLAVGVRVVLELLADQGQCIFIRNRSVGTACLIS